jgi:hypothetical protein
MVVSLRLDDDDSHKGDDVSLMEEINDVSLTEERSETGRYALSEVQRM